MVGVEEVGVEDGEWKMEDGAERCGVVIWQHSLAFFAPGTLTMFPFVLLCSFFGAGGDAKARSCAEGAKG